MNYIILTQVGGILKPFAWIFGQIFNLLYVMFENFGIHNIAITLVLFTIIVKMLLLPLTVRQQRFTKLNSKMQPELSAIQEKYKGRKDEQSMRLMQLEQQEVYSKYGTNPTSGCLPILITFPIMIAMYRIIYAIPAYVGSINELYTTIANGILSQDNCFDYLMSAAETLKISTKGWTEIADGTFSTVHVIDILTKFGDENWEAMLSTFPALNTSAITGTIEEINGIFSCFGLNILNSPAYYAKLNGFFNIALLVPILAAVTQLGVSFLSKAQNKTANNKKNNDNAVAQSMNSMLYVMPIMSAFFCYGFSLVIGIYWIINTVVSFFQQLVINIYIDKSDMDAYIAKNVEKAAKKKEKLGVLSGNQMAELAKKQTKTIDYSQPVKVSTTSSYANLGSSRNTSKNSNKKADNNTDESSDSSSDVKANAPVNKSVSGYANMLRRD